MITAISTASIFDGERHQLMKYLLIRQKNKFKYIIMNEVLVFKTSVCNQTDISKLKAHIDNVIKKGKWNFDLEDCDNILRVESKKNVTEVIIDILNKHGFECAELED
jgi:hypothetical protein